MDSKNISLQQLIPTNKGFKTKKFYGKNGKLTKTEIGYFVNNKLQGFGIRIFSDGSKLKANFKNGLAEGIGFYVEKKFRIIKGEFKNDVLDGFAIIKDDKGMIQCEYKNGKKDGICIKKKNNGYLKISEFKDNSENGLAFIKYHDGSTYSGEIKNGLRDGLGIHKIPNKLIYKGEWKNNSYQGFGISYNINKEFHYIGEFKNFHPEGIGSYIGKIMELNGLFFREMNYFLGQRKFNIGVNIEFEKINEIIISAIINFKRCKIEMIRKSINEKPQKKAEGKIFLEDNLITEGKMENGNFIFKEEIKNDDGELIQEGISKPLKFVLGIGNLKAEELKEGFSWENCFNDDKCCPICLENFKIKDKLLLLNCNEEIKKRHIFHLNCITNWIIRNDKIFCPICKSKIKEFEPIEVEGF